MADSEIADNNVVYFCKTCMDACGTMKDICNAIQTGKVHKCFVGYDNLSFNPDNFECWGINIPVAQDMRDVPLQPVQQNEGPRKSPKAKATDSLSPRSSKIAVWQKASTLALIEQYQKHEKMFRSTSFRNEEVWSMISLNLGGSGMVFTAVQCENRFKYLKKFYHKAIDNIKTTGGEPLNFEYFDESDTIFKKQPNVNPISSASSSEGFKRQKNDDENNENNEVTETPKKKKTKLEKELNNIKESFKEVEEKKESNAQRRHDEKMAVAQEAISSYKLIMEKLIEKL